MVPAAFVLSSFGKEKQLQRGSWHRVFWRRDPPPHVLPLIPPEKGYLIMGITFTINSGEVGACIMS